MSKQVSFSGWISIVPDKKVKSWITKKYIPNGKVLDFGELDANSKCSGGDVLHRMSLSDSDGRWKDSKWIKTNREKREYKAQGYKLDDCSILLIAPEPYEKMRNEVHDWYDKVFNYVEQWLYENNFLHIEKGSLQTGFCVETDPEHEVVKNWGAPLAKKGNKVVQMKEKFGRVVVYFGGITEEERKKIDAFAKDVEAKFDCVASFC